MVEETTWFEEKTSETIFKRQFTHDQLFEWHQDGENRKITIDELSGDWSFQFDDEFPISIKSKDVIDIQKDRWHRLIPPAFGHLSITVEKNC